jgi:hypothetical protein
MNTTIRIMFGQVSVGLWVPVEGCSILKSVGKTKVMLSPKLLLKFKDHLGYSLLATE